MSDILWQSDLSLYQFLNQTLSNNFFDHVMPFITDLDNSKIFKLVTLLIFVVWFTYKFKKKAGVLVFGLLVCLGVSDFTGGSVKRQVERPRPFQIEETHTIQRSEAKKNRSFYSNHSSNTFTVATYTSAFIPGSGLILFPIAAVVAFSRVYCGVHFPSDILIGGLIGILLGLLFSFLIKITLKFFESRKHV